MLDVGLTLAIAKTERQTLTIASVSIRLSEHPLAQLELRHNR
jgi:hypothetical protein